MFKKFALSAFLLLGVGSIVSGGDSRSIPNADTSNPLATADYGGVSFSTVTYSTKSYLCFLGEGVFQGVVLSSYLASSTTEYFIVRDTGSIASAGISTAIAGRYAENETDVTNTNGWVFKIYLPTAPINGAVGGYVWKPPFPIRVRRGLAVRTSLGNVIEMITPLWTDYR